MRMNFAEMLRSGARVRGVLDERHSDGVAHLMVGFAMKRRGKENWAWESRAVPDTLVGRNVGRLV